MNTKEMLKYLVFIAWAGVVLAVYYALFPIQHMAGELPVLRKITLNAGMVSDVFVIALVVLSANGWGNCFWRKTELNHAERFVFATGLGFCVISVIVFVLTIAGFMGRVVFFALLFFGIVQFLAVGKRVRGRIRNSLKVFAAISAVSFISTLIGALAPPTQFDSLVYHLALPQEYIRAGRYFLVSDNIFASFPQNMEMIFGFCMKIQNDIIANLAGWIFFPLTALLVYLMSKKYWNSQVAIQAAVIWSLTPLLMFISTGTYVDLGLAFYVLLSVYAVSLWTETEKNEMLVFSAVFAGFATGIKYIGLLNIVMLVPVIIYYSKPEKTLKTTLIFLAVSISVFSPWLIKNAVLFNNPIAPWGTELFKASKITAEQASEYFTHIRSHGVPVESFRQLLLLPWKMTFSPWSFGGGFDILGPVFLMFLPALFADVKIDKMKIILIYYVVFYLTCWTITGKVLRFIVPVFPLICILTAIGVQNLVRNNLLRITVIIFMVLALLHNFAIFHWVMAKVDPYSPVISGEGRNSYLSRKLNYYDAVHGGINQLEGGAKVLYWGETRRYYCSHDAIVPTVFDSNPLVAWSNGAGGTEELAESLRENGITHLFVNYSELERLGFEKQLTAKAKETLRRFVREKTERIYENEYCGVYKVNI
ncbi:MAG: glycosyltransferase family 39 protein [Endomicrobiales bacterium]|nr:glycosyltransferase family 39 protein [Endomicrobiales bacterium]